MTCRLLLDSSEITGKIGSGWELNVDENLWNVSQSRDDLETSPIMPTL